MTSKDGASLRYYQEKAGPLRLAFSVVVGLRPSRWDSYLGITLGYATASRTLRSCRTHFVVPKTSASGARAMTRGIVNFGDENTTGIESIDNSPWTMDSSDSAWFSLDGRKLSRKPATKGVYIHSGNKVIIK